MDISLTWIAIYIILVTISFNFLRYSIELNLLNSLILSTSVSFLISRIPISRGMGLFFVEHINAIIVVSILVTIILVTARPVNKSCDSTSDTNNQRKKWIVICRIRKG